MYPFEQTNAQEPKMPKESEIKGVEDLLNQLCPHPKTVNVNVNGVSIGTYEATATEVTPYSLKINLEPKEIKYENLQALEDMACAGEPVDVINTETQEKINADSLRVFAPKQIIHGTDLLLSCSVVEGSKPIPKPKFERGQEVRIKHNDELTDNSFRGRRDRINSMIDACSTPYHIFNPAPEHREAWPDSGRVFKDGEWHYLIQEKMFSGRLYKESELIAAS